MFTVHCQGQLTKNVARVHKLDILCPNDIKSGEVPPFRIKNPPQSPFMKGGRKGKLFTHKEQ